MTSPYVYPGLKKVHKPTALELIRYAVETASQVWDVTPEEIKGIKRTRYMVQARQFVMWYLNTNTDLSLKVIGARFGRDHSTVINSREVVQNAIDGYNPPFNDKIQQALTILNR